MFRIELVIKFSGSISEVRLSERCEVEDIKKRLEWISTIITKPDTDSRGMEMMPFASYLLDKKIDLSDINGFSITVEKCNMIK